MVKLMRLNLNSLISRTYRTIIYSPHAHQQLAPRE